MIHTMNIDTDPDDNLVLVLTNILSSPLPELRARLVAVIAKQFTPHTSGYVVVTETADAPVDETPIEVRKGTPPDPQTV